ncbi:MAG: PorT family protein [Flavobacteriales bacterium]|nr:PorT family protein [Flavobacteriales bacterium]
MRTLITTSLVVLATTSSWAQDGRWQLGVQAGPGLSWLRGNRLINSSDALLGPAAGLTVQYDLSERFGVRLGAGYQRKGSQVNATFTDVNGNPIATVKLRTALDQVTFPLMATAGFGTTVRLEVGAGGFVGVLLRGRTVPAGGSEFAEQDITDTMERLDAGVSASVGGAFDVGDNLVLRTEVRYDKGLMNISAVPVIDDGSIRTNAVSLLVGCSYRFGKTL